MEVISEEEEEEEEEGRTGERKPDVVALRVAGWNVVAAVLCLSSL